MPNWNSLLSEIRVAGTTFDLVRRSYLKKLYELTDRNVIVYYDGWLQKAATGQSYSNVGLNDNDKNGFMATIHELDRSKGLDLILQTPGGDIAATESLVDYLRSMFQNNIRAIVPQLAMSAGTMIALSCKEIILGRHSSLGPIDPQIEGVPAHGILEEFKQAYTESKNDLTKLQLWQPIIAKYHPTLIGECVKAIAWSNQVVKDWLISGMFEGEQDAEAKADKVLLELGDHALTKSHNRHISLKKAQEAGVKATALESIPALQEAVLTVHHACVLTLSLTPVAKIIENHNGIAFMNTVTPLRQS